MSNQIICDRCKLATSANDEAVAEVWAKLIDERNNAFETDGSVDLCGNCVKAFERFMVNVVLSAPAGARRYDGVQR